MELEIAASIMRSDFKAERAIDFGHPDIFSIYNLEMGKRDFDQDPRI